MNQLLAGLFLGGLLYELFFRIELDSLACDWIELTGLVLMADISASSSKQPIDLAEEQEITDNRPSVRIQVRTGMLECALVYRRESDPRHHLAINFDTTASESIVFGPFFRGSNSTNP